MPRRVACLRVWPGSCPSHEATTPRTPECGDSQCMTHLGLHYRGLIVNWSRVCSKPIRTLSLETSRAPAAVERSTCAHRFYTTQCRRRTITQQDASIRSLKGRRPNGLPRLLAGQLNLKAETKKCLTRPSRTTQSSPRVRFLHATTSQAENEYLGKRYRPRPSR